MTYKQSLKNAMNKLALDEKRLFIGYNVKYGSKANGTLADVPDSQLIEMPVAENLIAGAAVGLALEGFKPVVWLERFDFILNALDAIVNHLDKLKEISKDEFDPHVVFRVNVGSSKNPLFTGPTHTQDFSEVMRKLVSFPIVQINNANLIEQTYSNIDNTSLLAVEYRDLYDTE